MLSVCPDTFGTETMINENLSHYHLVESEGKPHRFNVRAETANGGMAINIAIEINESVEPNYQLTPDIKRFLSDLRQTAVSINGIAERIRKDQPPRLFHGRGEATRADVFLDRYIRQLANLGNVGMQSQHIEIAIDGLEVLKAEVVVTQAAAIKNAYLWQLAAAAILCAAISGLLLLLPLLSQPFVVPFTVPSLFLYGFIGASAGTWMSFSVRK